MAQKSLENRDVLIRISQKDFFGVLRIENPDILTFTVESIDDGDVLEVSVSTSGEHEENNNIYLVRFKMVDSLPDDKKAIQLVTDVFKDKGNKEGAQIALFVGKHNDCAKAYIRNNYTDPPKQIKIILNPSKESLYSRSRGILDSDLLEKKKVAIIGLGSGGSHIAVELAKAGVGHFILIDFDRIELSNIIRHTCGIRDLGRFKTKAVRDQILEKNPFARVRIHNIDINADLKMASSDDIGLKHCDIIIGATDTSRSRLNINDLAFEFNIPALFGQCKSRAAAGDVAVVRPGVGPCYSCICGGPSDNEEVSSFRQAREANPAYVSDAEVEAKIQVGLSCDIQPISNMVVKIALVELTKGSNSPLSPLEEDLRNPYYIWHNRNDAKTNYVKCMMHDLEYFDGASILRWYAPQKDKRTCNEKCEICSYKEENSSDDRFV